MTTFGENIRPGQCQPYADWCWLMNAAQIRLARFSFVKTLPPEFLQSFLRFYAINGIGWDWNGMDIFGWAPRPREASIETSLQVWKLHKFKTLIIEWLTRWQRQAPSNQEFYFNQLQCRYSVDSTLLLWASGKNRPALSALRPGGKSIFRPFSGKKGGKLWSSVIHRKRAENIPNSAL